MKKEIRSDHPMEDICKSCNMEIESINDIIERIEGLSYEGQRQILAYLKSQILKNKKD